MPYELDDVLSLRDGGAGPMPDRCPACGGVDFLFLHCEFDHYNVCDAPGVYVPHTYVRCRRCGQCQDGTHEERGAVRWSPCDPLYAPPPHEAGSGLGIRQTMPLWQSWLCLVVVPGAFAGVALGVCESRWTIPWWGTVGAGAGGWVIGFAAVALGRTVIRWLVDRGKADS